jgi:predicted metal-dependent hydrolase
VPSPPGFPPPPPPALREFLALFNRGEYWESHEVLERPWRRNRSDFYKGLILLASALVHAERGNRHGIVAQLRKASPLLERYRPHYLGLDVEAILSRVARALAGLEGLAEPEGSAPAATPFSPEGP